ncbi:hypothetical protein [Dyella sp. 2YAF14]|uniref:hypothetical protein n=1 Tax=Dyella sp. 2YAF14 TaxID=3233025 RepID=UPI003F928AB9
MNDKKISRNVFANDGMPSALMNKVGSAANSRGAPSAQMPRAGSPAPAPAPAPAKPKSGK